MSIASTVGTSAADVSTYAFLVRDSGSPSELEADVQRLTIKLAIVVQTLIRKIPAGSGKNALAELNTVSRRAERNRI